MGLFGGLLIYWLTEKLMILMSIQQPTRSLFGTIVGLNFALEALPFIVLTN